MKQKNLNVKNLITEFIDAKQPPQAITTSALLFHIAQQTGKNKNEFRRSASAALSNLLKTRPDFRRFKKGIYYRTEKTVLGDLLFDYASFVYRKYLTDGDDIIGYETGASLINRYGLNTAVPAHKYVATNKYKGRGAKEIPRVNLYKTKPIAAVNKDNYLYLQILEIVKAIVNKTEWIMDENPRVKVYWLISKRLRLDEERLARYASECKIKGLVEELKNIIREGKRYYTSENNEEFRNFIKNIKQNY
jgi:hypothetical protein